MAEVHYTWKVVVVGGRRVGTGKSILRVLKQHVQGAWGRWIWNIQEQDVTEMVGLRLRGPQKGKKCNVFLLCPLLTHCLLVPLSEATTVKTWVLPLQIISVHM